MWLSVSAEWNVFDRWSLLDHSLPTLFAPSRRVAVGRQLTNAHETTTSGESSGQATNLDERMVVAFESSVELLALSEERKEMSGKDKGGKIKALLDECGPFMKPQEKMKWGRDSISEPPSRYVRVL